MKILKIIFSRMSITIILLIIQVLIFAGILIRFVNYLPIITVLSYFLSVLIVLIIIKKDESSAYRIGWIIIIMTLPLFGGLLYLLFGGKRPAKKLHNRINAEHLKNATHLKQEKTVLDTILKQNERIFGSIQYIANFSSYPVYKNTSTKYYPFGELMYDDMLTELSKAKHFIFIEYFIISESEMWNGIIEILTKKAEEGVDIRIIYDDMGSLDLFTPRYVKQLKDLNIKILTFNPFVPFLSLVMNNRDHRKILIIDGHTAFNGGINIADEYINKNQRLGIWKDTGVLLKGEAAWSFSLMFLETWNAFTKTDEDINNFRPESYCKDEFISDGYVQPYGDSPLDNERLGENVYIDILNQAKKYVYIFTPYLIISDILINAIQMAAKRGVDVRIVTPGIPDKKIVYRLTRSYYKYLLEAGVKIYEYTPGFLHAKSFVCDDELAVVGTINLDYRSLYLHFECATLLYKSTSVISLKTDAEKTIRESKQITLSDCKQGFWGELFDSVLRLFAPLM